MRLAVPAYLFILITAPFLLSVVPPATSNPQDGSLRSQLGCVCVPYYQCSSDNTVLTGGEGLIDIRSLQTSSDQMEDLCDDYLQVCCKLPDSVSQLHKSQSTCGFSRSRRLQLQVPRLDAEEAYPGEFPWMVTIFRTKIVQRKNVAEGVKVYQCQGTLIHEKVVLTTAQCVKGWKFGNTTDPLSIRAGQLDTMTTKEEFDYQERDVQKVVVHKNYNAQRLNKNVALLLLKNPVTVGRDVDIICLAKYRDVELDLHNCVTIGWDKFLSPEDAYFQRSQVNILKKRIEPYVATAECVRLLRNTPLGRRFKLENSFICAGGNPAKNFCSREIGGPLACPLKTEPDRYVQLGIASWCISSGNYQTPSIFANVLQIRRWIDNQMNKLHLNSSVYDARSP